MSRASCFVISKKPTVVVIKLPHMKSILAKNLVKSCPLYWMRMNPLTKCLKTSPLTFEF